MDVANSALPLRKAYEFGNGKGLDDEIERIRSLSIEGMAVSPVRRGYIIDAFRRHGIWDEFVDKIWANGKTDAGLARIRRCENLRRQHEETQGDDEVVNADRLTDATEQSFVLESHLRDYLAKNLSVLENGLHLFEEDEKSGVEYPVEGGRIDILAQDVNGVPVVIELKLSRGRNRALGQILYYMGWVDKNLKRKRCRGFIVAQEIGEDLLTAASRTEGIELFKYELSMTTQKVGSGSSKGTTGS